MADLLDRQHFDAFLGLIRTDTTLPLYPDAEGFTPPEVALPYVRSYFWIERQIDAPGNSLVGLSSQFTVYFDLHCVGENEYSAAAMQMRVGRLVLDQRPTVAGRDCGLIRQLACQPPQKDNTTGRDVFDALCQYRFVSN